MATRYWVGNSGQFDDVAHWSLTSGGAGGASIPFGSFNDTAIFDVNSFTLDNQIVTNYYTYCYLGSLIIEDTLAKAFTFTGGLLLTVRDLIHIKTSLNVIINIPIELRGELINDTGEGTIASMVAVNGAKISGDNNITNLVLAPCSSVAYNNLTINALIIFEAGSVCTVGDLSVRDMDRNDANFSMIIDSDDEYEQFTISCPSGKTELEGTTVKNCIATGGAVFEALTSMFCVDGGGNTGWHFVPYSPRYWVGGQGSWTDIAHWSLTSNGVGGASVPTFVNDVIFDSHSFSSNNLIVDVGNGFVASFIVAVGTRPFKLSYYASIPEIQVHGNLTINNVSCVLCRIIMETDGTISGMTNCHLPFLGIGNYRYDKRTLPIITLTDGETVNVDYSDAQSIINLGYIPRGLRVDGKFYFSNATFNVGGISGLVELYGNTRGMEIHNTSGISTFNITGNTATGQGAEFYVDSMSPALNTYIVDLPDTIINIINEIGAVTFKITPPANISLTNVAASFFIDCDIYMKSPLSVYLLGWFYCKSMTIDVEGIYNTIIYGGAGTRGNYFVNVTDSFSIINTTINQQQEMSHVDVAKDGGVVSLSNMILVGCSAGPSIYGHTPALFLALESNGCMDGGGGNTGWIFGKKRTSHMTSTLQGISSHILIEHAPSYEILPIIFSISKKEMEDIPILFEYCSLSISTNIPLLFAFVNFDYYNYECFSVNFEVSLGDVWVDVPLLFSVIKQAQSYKSYIFQKLYCVTTEIGIVFEDLELLDWNVKPNQTWYLYINDTLVILYETLDDLIALSNPVASGTIDSQTLTVVFTPTDPYDILDFYYQDHLFHFSVSEIISGIRTFKIKPLTDMSEIRHAIYNNSNITISKGEAELNLHTFAVLGQEFVLGVHLPELETGDTVSFTNTRRNKITERSQVLSQTITGTVSDNGESSLINTIKVATYVELFR